MVFKTDSDARQTKDFVKFLSLVVILYLGIVTQPQPQSICRTAHVSNRLPYHIHFVGQGSVHAARDGALIPSIRNDERLDLS